MFGHTTLIRITGLRKANYNVINFQRCYIKIFENVQWLQEDFLGWLDEWEYSVMARDDLSLSERDRLCLSRETLDGLRLQVVNT